MDSRLSELYMFEARCLLEMEHAKTGDYMHPVFGEGKAPAGIMLIGEAPGGEEAKLGRPFVGKAGRQLDELLEKAGILREKIFVTNTVKYRPTLEKTRTVSNRTPSKEEIRCGFPLLRKELGIVSPRIVATLGNTPLYALLSLAGMGAINIGDAHGKSMPVCIDEREYLLFALYHPASAIYNRSLLPTLEADLCALGALCAKENIV